MRHLLLLLPLLLALVSCGGARSAADDIPSWAAHPPKAEGRLYGVGSAGDFTAAESVARRDLAAQLSVTVVAEREDRDVHTAVRATGRSPSERLESVARQRIETRIRQDDLPGVTVEAREQRGATAWVLVVFDRAAWASQLEQRLAGLDRRIAPTWEAFLVLSNQSAGPFQPLARSYLDLAPLLLERAALAERLGVAAPGRPVATSPATPTAARTRLSTRLDHLSLRLPRDSSVQALLPALTESLRGSGLRIASGEAQADLHLELTLGVDQRSIDGMQRLDGILRGRLLVADGSPVAALELSERAASANQATARHQLESKLAAALIQAIDEHLISWLAR